MKKLLMIALMMAMTSTAALADQAAMQAKREAKHAAIEKRHEERADAHFNHEKNERVQKISHRLAAAQKRASCLQTLQSCVNSASDMKALNACHGNCGD